MNTGDDVSMQTLDISNVQNDFIYKLIDFYLEEITLSAPDNISQSVINLVDTLMSYYLLAQQNGVINIDNARQMLSIKMGKDPNPNNNVLEQCKKLGDDFEELEKYIINSISNPIVEAEINDNSKTNSKQNFKLNSKLDELLDTHNNFMSDIQKQSSDIDKNNELLENIIGAKIMVQDTKKEKINKKTTKPKSEPITAQLISKIDIEPVANIMSEPIELSLDIAPDLATQAPIEHSTRLEEAMQQLYSRINTPLVNLLIGIFIVKCINRLLGFY